jgi:hypothetical protein
MEPQGFFSRQTSISLKRALSRLTFLTDCLDFLFGTRRTDGLFFHLEVPLRVSMLE